jgi:hypothetical protein
MRTILFTLMSATAMAAAIAGGPTSGGSTVYKWVDDDGVIHFSDQPHENATKVELKAPQTYTAQKTTSSPATNRSAAPGSSSSKPAQSYTSCSITEPTNDQMFMNTSTVNAGVVASPPIRPGDTAIVTMDGQKVPGVPAEGGQFTISPVDRGTHSIQVTIQDAQGHSICQSPSVTFHVHQPSTQAPQQPVHPR